MLHILSKLAFTDHQTAFMQWRSQSFQNGTLTGFWQQQEIFLGYCLENAYLILTILQVAYFD